MSNPAESTRETIQERGSAAVDELSAYAERAQEEIQTALERADTTTRRFVNDHPLAALAGAVAAGYLLGRLLARR